MTTRHTANILKELESDDELPDVYDDAVILPAYLLDNRFEDIKFPWINKQMCIKKPTKNQPANGSRMDIKHNENDHIKGMLKYQDLYCLKSVEPLTSDSTFLWFVNFLILKDLQSQNKYLKSVLVNDLTSSVPSIFDEYKQEDRPNKSNRYEIIIKHR